MTGRYLPGSSRTTIVLVAIVLVATLAIAPAAVAGQAANETDHSPDNTTVGGADYTLEELEANGLRPANAPPSIRPSGSFAEYGMKYLPTGPFYSEGGIAGSGRSWGWDYLTPSTTVSRNNVEIWSKRPYHTEENPVDDKTVTVHVVYWKRGTEPEAVGNKTVQRPAAVNITEQTTRATLGPGYDYVRIPLEEHYGDRYQVTVWIEGEEELARWRFTHSSTRATRLLPDRSESDRILWALGLLLVTFLASVSTLYGGRVAIERAGTKPHIPWWLLGIAAPFVLLGGILLWDSIINSLVLAPWLLAFPVGIVLGLLAAEMFGSRSYTDLFIKLKPDGTIPEPPGGVEEDVDRPDRPGGEPVATDGGETGLAPYERTRLGDIPSTISADVVPVPMTEYSNGEVGPVRRAFRGFLARAMGATTSLHANGDPRSGIDVDHGPYKKIYLVDPEADEPIAGTSEGWRWSFPDLVGYDDEGNLRIRFASILGGIFALFMGWTLGAVVVDNPLLGVATVGVLLTFVYVLEPVDGRAKVDLAPFHYDKVIQALLTHASLFGEVRQDEDNWRRYLNSETRRRIERREAVDERATTQLEEIRKGYLGESANGDGRDVDEEEGGLKFGEDREEVARGD